MGLIGGMARTAVVAGTATAVSNRVSRRQANRWSQQQGGGYYEEPQPQYAAPQPTYAAPPPAPAPAPAPVPAPGVAASQDRIAQLRELADLKAQGILSEAEFESEKARILAS
jgi:hypothetical protein